MSASESGVQGRITQSVQTKWGWFLALGIVLVIGGTLAIFLPVASTIATSIFLGAILLVGGAVQIFHALKVKTWSGFFWDMAIGLVQIVGGLIIYFDPFAGAVALTVIIAAIFLAQGLTQVMLAFAVRPHDGWGWLLFSGLLAAAVAVMLAVQFPGSSVVAPGILAGISILFSGWAYIAIALAARRLSV